MPSAGDRPVSASRRGPCSLVLCTLVAFTVVALGDPPPAHAKAVVETYTFEAPADAADWSLDANWAIAPLPDGGIGLAGKGSGFARLSAAGFTGDVTSLKLRVRLEGMQGAVHANLYETGFTTGSYHRYFVRIAADGIYLSLQTGSDCGGADCKTLGMAYYAVTPNLFHDVEILIGAGSLDVVLDGDPVVGVDLDPTQILPPGSISFEPASTGAVYIDEVAVTTGGPGPHPKAPRPPLSVPPGPDIYAADGSAIFTGGEATSDVSLTNQSITLHSGRYTMKNGAKIKLQNAGLRIDKGAVLVFDRGSSALFHTGVDLQGSSLLEMVGGTIIPYGNALVAVTAFGTSLVIVEDARPQIHFINAGGDAKVEIRTSRFVTSMGGGVMLGGNAALSVWDSRLGSVALTIPSGASLAAKSLPPTGVPITSLSLDPSTGLFTATTAAVPPIVTSGKTSNLKVSISFNQVILEPDVLGGGPYERGWVFPVGETGVLQLGSSSVRKIWVTLSPTVPAFHFSGLRLNQPTSTTVGGASLRDVTVTGQWGFNICESTGPTCAPTVPCKTEVAIFDKSEGLWLWPYQHVDVLLRDATMNEFDPRRYRGRFTIEGGAWEGGSEIIADTQGCQNDFRLRGGFAMDDYDKNRGSLSWSKSAVTREFPVQVLDASGATLGGARVALTPPSGSAVQKVADANGRTTFAIAFDDTNYALDHKWTLAADNGASTTLDFFSNTPVVLQGK